MDLIEPTSHSYVAQRLRLNYVDWGNPEKPPLVLVHGGRDHCRNWDWTARTLREDWHVLAIDLRGHGDSDWVSDGNYLSSDSALDLCELVEQLDLAPVTIVGHSFGGNVALRYAAAWPEKVRKLVVIEGLGLSPEAHTERMRTPYHLRVRKWMEKKRAVAGRTPRTYPGVEAAIARMQEAHPFLTHEQAGHLTRHGIRRQDDGSWRFRYDPAVAVFPAEDTAREDMEAAWAAIRCPVQLLYGADSWASDPSRDGRASHFRDARTTVIEGAGHWLHHQQFDSYIMHLKEFL